jgi:hypothetical protein
MISGVVLEDFCAGQKANTLEIQAALELIRLNADSLRWQIRSVDVSKGYCLIVSDRGHAKVTFGLDEIDRQLTRFYSILDDVEGKHREIQTVNLHVERNIPVTFVDDSEPPEGTPAPEIAPVKPPDKGAPKPSATSTPAPRTGGFSKPDDKAKPASATQGRRAVPTATPKRDSATVKKPFRT